MTQNQLTYMANMEKMRNNRVMEGNNAQSIANEFLTKTYANETGRMSQGEAVRHNLVTENQGMLSVRTAQQNADVARQNANTAAKVNDETNRHNVKVEGLTEIDNNWSNVNNSVGTILDLVGIFTKGKAKAAAMR